MTFKQVSTIDLNELKEVELGCECGASVRIPLPLKSGTLLAVQECPGCARQMWEGATHPTRVRLQRLLDTVEEWKQAANPVLAVRFVLTIPQSEAPARPV